MTVSRIKVDMHKIKKQSFSHSPDLQNKFSLTRDETVGGYRDLTMSVVFKDCRFVNGYSCINLLSFSNSVL